MAEFVAFAGLRYASDSEEEVRARVRVRVSYLLHANRLA